MKVTCLFLAFSLFACAEGQDHTTSARETGNGGDSLQILFDEQRPLAADAVAKMDAASVALIGEVAVRDWLVANQVGLAQEIRQSPFNWVNVTTETCAHTEPTTGAAITLSLPTCRAAGVLLSPADVQKLLVHESVHHFGVSDEAFANAVANAVGNPVDPLIGSWDCGTANVQRFEKGGVLNAALFTCWISSWERIGEQIVIHRSNCPAIFLTAKFPDANTVVLTSDGSAQTFTVAGSEQTCARVP